MPPDEIDKLNEKLNDQLKATIKLRTETKLYNKAIEALKVRFNEGMQTLGELEAMQAGLNKTLGVDGTDATNKISNAFVELNKSMLGLQEANIQGAFEGIRKSFALTNKEIVKQAGSTADLKIAMDKVSKSIAKNSNVIDQSKLVDFTNKFTFQTGLAVNKSEQLGERLVGLAYRLGLPNEQLLTLGQNMLSTGNYFGETTTTIEEATLKATEFGRALGTTGDVVNKQLESMQTISGRQQLAARLSQIGSMVGVDIDISKLMSADPDEQRQGLRDALRKFSSSSKNLTGAQQRALSLTLSKALPSFGREAIQTALVRGVDIEDAQKKIQAAKDAVAKDAITDKMRREAATTAQRSNLYFAARQREVGRMQLKAAGGMDGASKKLIKVAESFKKSADKIAEAADKAIKGDPKQAVAGLGKALKDLSKELASRDNAIDAALQGAQVATKVAVQALAAPTAPVSPASK
jgi:hypothetical protein